MESESEPENGMSERLLERVHLQIGQIRRINWGNLKQRISIERLASFYEYYLKPISHGTSSPIFWFHFNEYEQFPEIFTRTNKSYSTLTTLKYLAGKTNAYYNLKLALRLLLVLSKICLTCSCYKKNLITPHKIQHNFWFNISPHKTDFAAKLRKIATK